MHGASAAALVESAALLDARIDASSADELRTLGSELFAVTDLLDATISLRRAVSDPARSGDDRAGLLRGLLAGQVSAPAADVVAQVAHARWSSAHDLVDAMEVLAVRAVVGAADRAGRLDTLEDDLFRFRRIVDGDVALRAALTDASVDTHRRRALLEDLLADRVGPESQALVRQAFLAPRERSFDRVLEQYGAVAAQRRNRLVARVVAAQPLSGDQQQRLAGALARIYGREPHLDVEVDPDVVGGLRVQVGDEVIDGTVAMRLADARRRLAG